MQLIFSSLFFITNVFSTLQKKYYLYSIFFGLLVITSLLIHSQHTMLYNIVDKIVIACIVITGGFYTYKNYYPQNFLLLFIIFSTFFGTIYFYIYGYFTKSLCFHPQLGNDYHYWMHFIGSLGHHCICLL
jgi:hypothetical protein